MAIKQMMDAAGVALANTLASGLPAALDAIASAYGDSIPLPHPAAVYPRHISYTPESPYVMVNYLTSAETSDRGPLEADMEHHYDVMVAISSDDENTGEAQILRYLQAIYTVLMQEANQNLDGSLSGLTGVALRQAGKLKQISPQGKVLGWIGGWEVVVYVTEPVMP